MKRISNDVAAQLDGHVREMCKEESMNDAEHDFNRFNSSDEEDNE